MIDTFAGLDRPLPVMSGLSKEFHDWCRQGELRFQRCSHCGAFRHVPREICAQCSSFDWTWEKSSGLGTIFTFTVVARALHPAFAKAVPYAPVVVEMAEGVRLVSRVVDCPPDQLAIGMAVRVDFETVGDVVLPCFRRV